MLGVAYFPCVRGEMVMDNCSHCIEQCGKVSCSERNSLGELVHVFLGVMNILDGVKATRWVARSSDTFFSSVLQNSRK